MIGYNTLVVLAGCALLGLAAGTIGAFALLRGRALMADAMGHAALPGVALAALIVAAFGGDPRSVPPLLLGAAVAGALGALAVHALARTGRVRDDAAIAVVLGSFYAAGVALLSLMQTMPGAAQAGLSRFILGQAAAMRAADAAWTAGLAALCLVAALLLFRALRAVAFDADFARAQGLPVGLLDLALLGLILLVCVAGLQAVGLILVVALLVLPALTARLLAERLPALLALSAATGALAGAAGAYASAVLPSLPTGAAVVLAAALAFAAALLFSPRRGLLALAWRRLSERRAAAAEHVLRAAWEAQEAAGKSDGDSWIRIPDIAAARGWTAARTWRVVRWMGWRGLLARAGDAVHLTPAGLGAARAAVAAHRAAEHHLIARGAADAASADRLADLVEHSLPAMLRPDPSRPLPDSPHAVGGRA